MDGKDLHTVSVILKDTTHLVRLVFITQENARAGLLTIRSLQPGDSAVVTDDYDNEAFIRGREVVTAVLARTASELQCNQDVSFLQTHAQIKFQKRCEQDAELMAFAKTQNLRQQLLNGGSVVNPGRQQ